MVLNVWDESRVSGKSLNGVIGLPSTDESDPSTGIAFRAAVRLTSICCSCSALRVDSRLCSENMSSEGFFCRRLTPLVLAIGSWLIRNPWEVFVVRGFVLVGWVKST